MSFLTVFGTIASILGAVISFHQSKKSRDAAEEAKNARAQIVDHRKTSDLTHIQSFCKKALRSIEKYGPGSVPSSLVGISPNSDAKDVQEFITSMREHRHYFGTKTPNESDEFVEAITPLLDDFAQSSEPVELRTAGKQMLVYLADISSIIKRHLDSKKETYR